MSSIKFKNTGKRLKDFKNKNIKNKIIEEQNKKPIGIILPLQEKKRNSESLFAMTYNISDQVKVNLKNLILTQKGEMICNPNFGTNLIAIYNSTNLESVEEVAMNEIQSSVNTYMPFVNLTNFSSIKKEYTENTSGYYELEIDYFIEGFENINKLTLNIEMSR